MTRLMRLLRGAAGALALAAGAPDLPAQYPLPDRWEVDGLSRSQFRDLKRSLTKGATRERFVDCPKGNCSWKKQVVTQGPVTDIIDRHLADNRTVVVGLMVAPAGNSVEHVYHIRQSESLRSEFLVVVAPRQATDPPTGTAGRQVIGRWFLVAVDEQGDTFRLRRFSTSVEPNVRLVIKCERYGAGEASDFLTCTQDSAAHDLAQRAGAKHAAVIGCVTHASDYTADHCFRAIAEAAAKARGGNRSGFDAILGDLRSLRKDWLGYGPAAPYWFQCDGGCCTADATPTVALPGS